LDNSSTYIRIIKICKKCNAPEWSGILEQTNGLCMECALIKGQNVRTKNTDKNIGKT